MLSSNNKSRPSTLSSFSTTIENKTRREKRSYERGRAEKHAQEAKNSLVTC